jgi:hypothetical protein
MPVKCLVAIVLWKIEQSPPLQWVQSAKNDGEVPGCMTLSRDSTDVAWAGLDNGLGEVIFVYGESGVAALAMLLLLEVEPTDAAVPVLTRPGFCSKLLCGWWVKSTVGRRDIQAASSAPELAINGVGDIAPLLGIIFDCGRYALEEVVLVDLAIALRATGRMFAGVTAGSVESIRVDMLALHKSINRYNEKGS